MHITAINSFKPSFSGRDHAYFPFTHISKNSNPYSSPVDTIAFATKPNKKQEFIRNILKEAKIGNEPRFSKHERMMIEKEIENFHSYVPKADILKKLLSMEYNRFYSNGKKAKLSVSDIGSFFNVLKDNETTVSKKQINCVLNLINFSLKENFALNSEELDNLVYLPIENHPNLIKLFNKFEVKYSQLNSRDRSELLHYTLDVLKGSNFKHNKDLLKIANAIYSDSTGLSYKILMVAAENCKRTSFKNVLNSFTPDNLEQIKEDTKYLQREIDKYKYINNYIKQNSQQTFKKD